MLEHRQPFRNRFVSTKRDLLVGVFILQLNYLATNCITMHGTLSEMIFFYKKVFVGMSWVFVPPTGRQTRIVMGVIFGATKVLEGRHFKRRKLVFTKIVEHSILNK